MSDSFSLTKKEMVLLGVFFFAALAIRLYFLQFYKVISADGVGYVRTAREIAKGSGLGGMTVYGAVYPTLVAAAGFLVKDLELAGRLVSVVMGSLLVVPLYLLSLEFFTRRAGLLACMLVLVWPSLRSWSCEVMTQATYITLLLTGIYVMWLAWRKDSLPIAFGAGLIMSLSYLTRPEALVTFVVMTGALLAAARLKGIPLPRMVSLAAVGCAGFALPLLPYVWLVHSVTGKWQLAGKTGNTLADALSEYLGRPDMKNEPGFQGIGVLDVVRQYPDFLWSNFLKNLTTTMQTMVPLYLWVLSFMGVASYGWDRDKIGKQLYLVSTFTPLLVIMVLFFIGPEYLQPYLPVLFLWSAAGLLRLEELLLRGMRIDTWPRVARLTGIVPLSALLVLWIAVSTLRAQIPADADGPYNYSQDGARYDQKRIGLMLKQVLPPDSRIMTRWGRISFYAEMEQVMIPQAGIPELVDAIRKNRAQYVVVDGMLAGMRPQYEILFRPLAVPEEKVYYLEKGEGYRPLPNLRLKLLYKDPSSIGVALYEVTD